MPPCHSVGNQLLLHQHIRNGALWRSCQYEVFLLRGAARRVTDDTLSQAVHLLRRDRLADGKRKESRGHHRHHGNAPQIHPLKAKIVLRDPVDDQVCLVFEKPLPRARYRVELEMQTRLRCMAKEPAQQSQERREWAQVTEHHAQLGLLSHCQLFGMDTE